MSGFLSKDDQTVANGEVSMRALLEEEFRAVFGGTEPDSSAWLGLTFA